MTEKYISLKEATKYCSYSQDYLRLRVRQGKLKAIKMGRDWFTTKQWLEEYLEKFSKANEAQRLTKTTQKLSISRFRIGRNFLFIVALVLFFIILGMVINFKPVKEKMEKTIPAKTIEIH